MYDGLCCGSEPGICCLKSDGVREIGEEVLVAGALAQRSYGLVGDLQVVMPIGSLQFFMLEKRSRGKNQVGIIHGISEKLLVHNCEQVGTLEAADPVSVIRGNRRRIRVINKDRFDRRTLYARKRLA